MYSTCHPELLFGPDCFNKFTSFSTLIYYSALISYLAHKSMFILGNNIRNNKHEIKDFHFFHILRRRKFSLVYTPSCCKISDESIKPSQSSELKCTKSMLTPNMKNCHKYLNFSFFNI